MTPILTTIAWLVAGLALRYAARQRRLFLLAEERLRGERERRLEQREGTATLLRRASLRIAEQERVIGAMRAKGRFVDRWLS